MSFFYYTHEKAAKYRMIFANVFHYSNLRKYAPTMCDMLNQETEKLIKEKGINSETFTRISVKEFLCPNFERILNVLLFGDPAFHYGKSGKTIGTLMQEWMDLVPIIRRNPLYVLMPWITSNLSLLEAQRKVYEINREILEVVSKVYKEREAKGNLGTCGLDQMILHNQQCKREGRTEDFMDDEVILGNVNLLQIAGTDTSQSCSIMALCKFAENPELQKEVRDINTRLYDENGCLVSELLDSDPQLDLWIKEVLRLYNPSNRLTLRIATKEVKLKDITVLKGDLVSTLYHYNRHNEKIFSDPEHFDPKRFEKPMDKDNERYGYTPFWTGRRVCMGKNLGEMMVKICVTQFIRSFEMRKPADVEYFIDHFMLSHESNPYVEVKLPSKKSN